jgi:hypothetical protein
VSSLLSTLLSRLLFEISIPAPPLSLPLPALITQAYPDPVRVVSIGVDVDSLVKNPTNTDWTNFSIEFCGGTHLTNTSEAVDFVIVSEGTDFSSPASLCLFLSSYSSLLSLFFPFSEFVNFVLQRP